MSNSVEVESAKNSVEITLFDVYTTSYFLQPFMILEEHKEAGDDG